MMTDRHQRLNQAYGQHVRSELTDQATTLDRVYKAHEQQKRHEHEQAVAAQARRRRRSAIIALVLFVCACSLAISRCDSTSFHDQ